MHVQPIRRCIPFGISWILITLSQVFASGVMPNSKHNYCPELYNVVACQRQNFKQGYSAFPYHPWCYNEEKCAPANWGGICKTGTAQSPVDFSANTVTHSRHLRRIRVNQEYLRGYDEFYVKNNGHTVQLQLREDLTSALRIDSDGFRGTQYQLSQLHFHWGKADDVGSEHTINGTSYPMELHLVHFSDKYSNLLEAVTDQNPRALAVFGIFFDISPEDNSALTPIIESLSIVHTYHPDPAIFKPSIPLNYSNFFPSVLDVYRYEGSLTTPSCGQKVIWTVFKNPVPISEKQMQAFRAVKDTFNHRLADNFRPTQPLGRRKIYESTVHLTELPGTREGQDIRSSVSSNENNEIEKTKYTTHENEPGAHEHTGNNNTNSTSPCGRSSSPKSIFEFKLLLAPVTFLLLHVFP